MTQQPRSQRVVTQCLELEGLHTRLLTLESSFAEQLRAVQQIGDGLREASAELRNVAQSLAVEEE